MGVTHGKKVMWLTDGAAGGAGTHVDATAQHGRDHNLPHSPAESRTRLNEPASESSILQTHHQDEKEGGEEEPAVDQEAHTPPSQLQGEEESSSDQETQTPPSQLQGEEESSSDQEAQTPPSQLQGEERENSDLIRPKKPLNPVLASKSHQKLHKELQITQKCRGVCADGKTELQLVLEKRNREQRMRERRDQEEVKKIGTPLYKELLKRHQRLDESHKTGPHYAGSSSRNDVAVTRGVATSTREAWKTFGYFYTLEREKERQQDGPEFLRIRERLRRTTALHVGEKEV